MNGCTAITVAILVSTVMSSPAVTRGQSPQKPSQFTAYPLKRANAARIVEKLRTLPGKGVMFDSEEETNTVFLRACPEKIQQAKKILDQLDVGVPDYLTVVALQHTDAAKTVNPLRAILTLTSFFDLEDSDIRITTDERGNEIIISATEETMQRAAVILHWLDGKGE